MSFTGLERGGKNLSHRLARPDFKHVSLEMGGKNIIIVMDDANLDLAVVGRCGRFWDRRDNGAQRRVAWRCTRKCTGNL